MAMGKIDDRIKKMKDAIRNEAGQRAEGIIDQAEEEADIERNNIIKSEKLKVDEEYAQLNQAEKTKARMYESLTQR
jgi:vacuolar-type H+-ATPase subunit H